MAVPARQTWADGVLAAAVARPAGPRGLVVCAVHRRSGAPIGSAAVELRRRPA